MLRRRRRRRPLVTIAVGLGVRPFGHTMGTALSPFVMAWLPRVDAWARARAAGARRRAVPCSARPAPAVVAACALRHRARASTSSRSARRAGTWCSTSGVVRGQERVPARARRAELRPALLPRPLRRAGAVAADQRRRPPAGPAAGAWTRLGVTTAPRLAARVRRRGRRHGAADRAARAAARPAARPRPAGRRARRALPLPAAVRDQLGGRDLRRARHRRRHRCSSRRAPAGSGSRSSRPSPSPPGRCWRSGSSRPSSSGSARGCVRRSSWRRRAASRCSRSTARSPSARATTPSAR